MPVQATNQSRFRAWPERRPVCRNPRCKKRFLTRHPTKQYCTRACSARARTAAYWRRDHPLHPCTDPWRPVVGFEGVYRVARDGRIQRVLQGRHTRPGRLITPGSDAIWLQHGPLIRRTTRRTVVREAWGDEAAPPRRGRLHLDEVVEPLAELAPRHCWCWPAIRDLLNRQGSASVTQLARASYGSDDSYARRAMAAMTCELAKTLGSKYLGAPYLVRVRWGWYALATGAQALIGDTEDIVRHALEYRPQTVNELATKASVKAGTVHAILTRMRSRGTQVHERRAPKAKWSGKHPCGWCNEYWLGTKPATRAG